jgi:hypothetical protein
MNLDPSLPLPWLNDEQHAELHSRSIDFKRAYGNRKVDLEMLNQEFVAQVGLWQKRFDPAGVLASNSSFLLLEHDLAFCLQEEGLGISLANGPAMTIGKHAFLYTREQDTLYTMHAKLGTASATQWERSTIQQLLKEALLQIGEKGEIAHNLLRESFDAQVQNIPKLDRSLLLYTRKAKQPKGSTLVDISRKIEDERELRITVGYLGNRQVYEEEFLNSQEMPNTEAYRNSFLKRYAQITDFLFYPGGQQLILERFG